MIASTPGIPPPLFTNSLCFFDLILIVSIVQLQWERRGKVMLIAMSIFNLSAIGFLFWCVASWTRELRRRGQPPWVLRCKSSQEKHLEFIKLKEGLQREGEKAKQILAVGAIAVVGVLLLSLLPTHSIAQAKRVDSSRQHQQTLSVR